MTKVIEKRKKKMAQSGANSSSPVASSGLSDPELSLGTDKITTGKEELEISTSSEQQSTASGASAIVPLDETVPSVSGVVDAEQNVSSVPWPQQQGATAGGAPIVPFVDPAPSASGSASAAIVPFVDPAPSPSGSASPPGSPRSTPPGSPWSASAAKGPGSTQRIFMRTSRMVTDPATIAVLTSQPGEDPIEKLRRQEAPVKEIEAAMAYAYVRDSDLMVNGERSPYFGSMTDLDGNVRPEKAARLYKDAENLVVDLMEARTEHKQKPPKVLSKFKIVERDLAREIDEKQFMDRIKRISQTVELAIDHHVMQFGPTESDEEGQ